MATPQKLALSEIHLLQREIEALGEDYDQLRMELESLKRVITKLHPEFPKAFEDEMEVVRIEFNPETSGRP